MHRDLNRPLLQVEAVLSDFLLRGSLTPLGELLNFLNDRRRGAFTFAACELLPLSPERQLKGIKQDTLTVNRSQLVTLALLDEAQAAAERLLKASRSVVFYTAQFAIQGELHVNVDARDSDLMDDSRDFYPLSQATLFSLRPIAQPITRQVPLLMLQRAQVQAYHLRR